MTFLNQSSNYRPTSGRTAFVDTLGRLCFTAGFAVALIATTGPRAGAQTDYYNTDKGRPLTIEDAYPTERYAFEVQVAPLRLERTKGGVYQWAIEPELTYGILPRTHLEIGAPFSYVDVGGGSRKAGLAGVDISVLHNLNVETLTLPALAVLGNVLLPAGGFGPERAVYSAKGIATRTIGKTRFHLNGSYAFGSDLNEERQLGVISLETQPGRVEVPRWLGGIAADRTFPLRSMLIGAEVFAERPLVAGADVGWNAATGIRYQLSPYFNVDGGVGKQLNGDDRSWFATFGLSRSFALRSLFPVP